MYLLMDFLVACDQICIEPLTATPIGSPCGCVFPMKARLLLDVATLSVFPVMREIEIEIRKAPIWSKAKLKLWVLLLIVKIRKVQLWILTWFH